MERNSLLINLLGILSVLVANSIAREGIIGGTTARVNQFHYQVSLLVDGQHRCGGGIIDHQHILTAAHCVLSEHNNFLGSVLTVTAGTNNLNYTTSPPVVHDYVTKIYVPKAFHPQSRDYSDDIAVLKLKHPLDLLGNQFLKSLILPTNGRGDFEGRVARISGFGRSKVNLRPGESYSDGFMRGTEAHVISNNQCQEAYDDRPITAKQICARALQSENVHRGVCIGDDGSPLVIATTVIGVLSSIPEHCTERVKPGIYTRVTSHKDFIIRSMNNIPLNDIRVLEIHR